jgi:subtilisin family serine protease
LADNTTVPHTLLWPFCDVRTTVSERDVVSELVSRLPGLDRLWAITKGRPEIVIAVLDGPVDGASVADRGPSGAQRRCRAWHPRPVHRRRLSRWSRTGTGTGLHHISIPIFAPAAHSAQQICTQEELAAGIRTALDRKATSSTSAPRSDLLALSHDLSSALQAAAASDALVVAAAGNQGCACDTIPASVAGVLAVGAHNDTGSPLLSSNWGPGQRTQGVIAPGSNVPGACVGGGLCRATGTSFATATVSGIAGLLMSMDVERGGKPSGDACARSCCSPAPHPHPTRSNWHRRISPAGSTCRALSTTCTGRRHLSPMGRGRSP